MNLRYITCSDPREHIAPDQIIQLLRNNQNAEIAVQAHPTKMSFDMPRHTWFDDVLHHANICDTPVNLAVHVNREWAHMLCRGVVAPELIDWFYARKWTGAPLIHRWQININGLSNLNFYTYFIAKMVANNPDKEFIFQYGPDQYDRIHRLADTGVNFSVLYDASGGNGIAPRRVQAPLFDNHPQGYSGGISPENVAQRLDKIQRVAPNRNDIWIDAEGKLKDPTTKQFDIERARAYIKAANNWHNQHVK